MPFHGGVTGNNRHINMTICLRQATLLNQANSLYWSDFFIFIQLIILFYKIFIYDAGFYTSSNLYSFHTANTHSTSNR